MGFEGFGSRRIGRLSVGRGKWDSFIWSSWVWLSPACWVGYCVLEAFFGRGTMEDRIGGQQPVMEDRVAENGEDEFAELGADQKVALGKWFLLNSPPGQVQQVAKGIP